ncbi:glutamine amidotransferase [Fibrobacterota bacterium]
MYNILLVKVGTTLPSLVSKKGDFEDWILSGMGIGRDSAVIVDVCNGLPLPDYKTISGVVIQGSHVMVTEHHNWSERTAEWLRGAVQRSIPVLGICYGHQLLAYALGGEVGDNPKGREYGTVEIHLSEEGRKNTLFNGFRTPFSAQVSHDQSVLKLPNGAKKLAWSEGDENQAFVFNDTVWGVQFHPEFDKEIVMAYINYKREALLNEGKYPDELISQCKDTSSGKLILSRFAELVN